MPNHITNITIIKGGEKNLAKVLKEVGKSMDFNAIVPMPEGIENSEYVYFGDKEKQAKIEAEHKKNIEKYGFPTWYEWSRANWGTKWNAYDKANVQVKPTELIYVYSTAWSCPEEVLVALAKKFGVEVSNHYADEDYGYNCGILNITPEGEVSYSNNEEGTKEAEDWTDEVFDTAFQIKEEMGEA